MEQRSGEHAVFSLLILSVLLIALTVVVVCSGCAKKIATPDDPKDAVETYLNALAESDWDTAYYMVDKNTKDNHSQEEFEEATNTVYGPEFKEMLTRIEVVDSQTSGDSATVTIRDKVTGNNMEEKLVREDGEWKVTSPDPE